ncbi:hypothetical protein CEXT_288241 [Caerostris extrusa]|uniref:Uncharacterized protein n=1 Tax=Caerostris extrusa TaxID=172846 RepID=A0AAV4MQP5_CAEEX|nr:hypothetical protein CEXT_288241 [Caerostris extrusa]
MIISSRHRLNSCSMSPATSRCVVSFRTQSRPFFGEGFPIVPRPSPSCHHNARLPRLHDPVSPRFSPTNPDFCHTPGRRESTPSSSLSKKARLQFRFTTHT